MAARVSLKVDASDAESALASVAFAATMVATMRVPPPPPPGGGGPLPPLPVPVCGRRPAATCTAGGSAMSSTTVREASMDATAATVDAIVAAL